MYNPSGALVRFTQSSGWGFSVTNDIDLCIMNADPEGDYEFIVEFDIIGDQHFWDRWFMPKFGAARFAYVLDYVWSGASWQTTTGATPVHSVSI